MGVLPIGFFAPLPLAIMIPFMAAQSFAMGQAFGTSFQYGKRKISSMSNEEFNALSATRLHDDLQADVRAMIPSMNQSFERMERFQIEIIQSMLDTFVLALQEFGKFLTGGVSAVGDSIQQGINTDVLTVDTRSDIPDFIPQAEGSVGDDQKFVTDYLAEARALPFKLLADIVEKLLSGKLPNTPIEKRIAYIQVYKDKLPVQKKKPTQAEIQAVIDAKAAGIVKQIATLFAQLKFALSQTNPLNGSRVPAFRATFLLKTKEYNRLVQGSGRRNLTIDTAKSLAARRIIPRF